MSEQPPTVDHSNMNSAGRDITAGGFFATLPNWAKGIIAALTMIPLSFAISGQILGVRVGDYLDQYMEIQLEAMRSASAASADRVIATIGLRIDGLEGRLGQVETEVSATAVRVATVETWACTHADTQTLTADRPDFCN